MSVVQEKMASLQYTCMPACALQAAIRCQAAFDRIGFPAKMRIRNYETGEVMALALDSSRQPGAGESLMDPRRGSQPDEMVRMALLLRRKLIGCALRSKTLSKRSCVTLSQAPGMHLCSAFRDVASCHARDGQHTCAACVV